MTATTLWWLPYSPHSHAQPLQLLLLVGVQVPHLLLLCSPLCSSEVFIRKTGGAAGGRTRMLGHLSLVYCSTGSTRNPHGCTTTNCPIQLPYSTNHPNTSLLWCHPTPHTTLTPLITPSLFMPCSILCSPPHSLLVFSCGLLLSLLKVL